MRQGTDQAARPALATQVLVAVADHLNATSPDDVLDQQSLLISFGAEAYKLKGRSLNSGAQDLAKAALALAPERTDGMTRREYAGELVRLVAGHDWPDGDNDPAIPRITGIPGQRTEPSPVRVPVQPQDGDR
ncbi:hypothetical protein EES44_24570 [Streptomyces sp. ADI96-15]|uniref:hypothetical protein n=1 Tax=Streptomyces sp. ADI96-15 TaxID=1522761 RepID=UPI000F552321|nr:hypothetical protein [Streptomyces sp. ADI96-15]RPK58110.1 hypothetical protein EES44_24570 [Streptomyces sp. ADI96-15]